MEAFVMRLAQFHGNDEDMESIASMVANKPSRSWVDVDIDRTTVELAEMAQKFMRSRVLLPRQGTFQQASFHGRYGGHWRPAGHGPRRVRREFPGAASKWTTWRPS